jgi:GntR family transcriptional regulator / MocR family aminotransferase
MKFKINLDRNSAIPLNRQLYVEMTKLILNGTLKPGEKIPSTRHWALDLDVSRPTITACLEQLVQEGYIETRPGSGSYVSSEIVRERPSRATRKVRFALSDFGRFVSKLPQPDADREEPEISFYCWRPALDQFPLTEWARIVGRHARTGDATILDISSDSQGSESLRRSLSGLVKRFRGVDCLPDQIVLVNGLNQGLDLVARLHLSDGSACVVEDPGFLPTAFKACGAKLVPVPVDKKGMRVEKLPVATDERGVDLAYVTPARQFPTGTVMPLSRRLAFLEWARKHDVLVLEDDYDSEYQAAGKPIPALMSLDADERVIYLGTLNQLMFPSLSLGYLIVPLHMVALYRAARELAGAQLSRHIQAAVADFIDEGHLDRHVKRLRSLYSERRSVLVTELQKRFGDSVSIGSDSSGVFVLVRFNLGISEDELIDRAKLAGVGLMSSRSFYLRKTAECEFIMGFGSLDETQIRKGIRKLAAVLK